MVSRLVSSGPVERSEKEKDLDELLLSTRPVRSRAGRQNENLKKIGKLSKTTPQTREPEEVKREQAEIDALHKKAIENWKQEQFKTGGLNPAQLTAQEDQEWGDQKDIQKIKLPDQSGETREYSLYFKATAWSASGDETHGDAFPLNWGQRNLGKHFKNEKEQLLTLITKITSTGVDLARQILDANTAVNIVPTQSGEQDISKDLNEKLVDYIQSESDAYKKTLGATITPEQGKLEGLNLMGKAVAYLKDTLLPAETELNDEQRAKIASGFEKTVEQMWGIGYADYSAYDRKKMLPVNKGYARDNGLEGANGLGLKQFGSSVFLNPEDDASDPYYLGQEILLGQLGDLKQVVHLMGVREHNPAANTAEALIGGLVDDLKKDEKTGRERIAEFLNQTAIDNWNADSENKDKQPSTSTEEEKAAHLAVEKALDQIGRGFLVVPPSQSTISVQYSVDLKESKPVLDAGLNSGEVTSYMRVVVDKSQSLLSEYPPAFIAGVAQAVLAVNPADASVPTVEAATIDLSAVKPFDEGAKTTYVFPINTKFHFSTFEEAKNTMLRLNMPSALVPHPQPLLIEEVWPVLTTVKKPKTFTAPTPSSWRVDLDLGVVRAGQRSTEADQEALLFPGPSGDVVSGTASGDQTHRKVRTDPTLQNLGGTYLGIDWLANATNADMVSHLMDDFASIYDIKPEIVTWLGKQSVLNKTTVNQAWLDYINNPGPTTANPNQPVNGIIARYGQSIDQLNSWSNNVMGNAVADIYRLAFFRWAAEQTGGTPYYDEIEREKEHMDNQVTADSINAITGDSKAKAQVVNTFLHEALEDLHDSAFRTGARLRTNFGTDNFQLSASVALSPTIDLPWSSLTTQYSGAILATVDALWYPFRLRTPTHEMNLSVDVWGGLLMPQGVRTTPFDTELNTAVNALTLAAGKVNADLLAGSDPTADWQTALSATQAVQAIFQKRLDAGDGNAKDGVDNCARGILYAQQQNWLQFNSTVQANQRLATLSYSGGKTSNASLDVFGYGIDNHYFSSTDPVFAKTPVGDISVKLDGSWKPGEGWTVNYVARMYAPPALLSYIAELAMSANKPPYAQVMSTSERAADLRDLMPQFNSWVPSIPVEAQVVREFMVFNRQMLLSGNLAFNVPGAHLENLGASVEYFPNLLGRTAPESIKLTAALQNPIGTSLMPWFGFQLDQGFENVWGGQLDAQVRAVRGIFPYGGAYGGNLEFRAVYTVPLVKGEEAAPRPPKDFTQWPADYAGSDAAVKNSMYWVRKRQESIETLSADSSEADRQALWDAGQYAFMVLQSSLENTQKASNKQNADDLAKADAVIAVCQDGIQAAADHNAETFKAAVRKADALVSGYYGGAGGSASRRRR